MPQAPNNKGRLTGTVNDDTLIGLDHVTYTVKAFAGNDSIIMGSGNDTIFGDEGNDTIVAGRYGKGNDLVFGGAGDDQITGSGGSEKISGGEGNDNINLVTYTDPYYLGNMLVVDYVNATGNSIVDGGSGDDYINGGYDATGRFANDTLYGGAGNDWIGAGTGNCILYGEKGDDVLGVFLSNNSTLHGGEGNDFLNIMYGKETTAYGDKGVDQFSFTVLSKTYNYISEKHLKIMDFGNGNTSSQSEILNIYSLDSTLKTAEDVMSLLTVSGGDSNITFLDGSKITIVGNTNFGLDDFVLIPMGY